MSATVHRLHPAKPPPEPAANLQVVTCGICGVPHHATACQVLQRHLDWLSMRGLAQTTIYDRKRALVRLAAALPGPILDATEADLMAWRASLAHLAPVSIRTSVGHVKEFYKHAVTEGIIVSSPAEKLPVPRRPRRLPRPVSDADLFAALKAAPPRVRPWLILAAYCGLRAREIAYLRREDVLEHAQPPVLLVTDRAAKGGRERMIPLHHYVLAEVIPVLPSHGWAFPRCDGRKGPNRPWMICKLANETLHGAGVAATLHQLRHRCATSCYQASHDLLGVAALLGHASVQSTAGYARWADSSLAEMVSALPVPGAQPEGG